MTGPFFEHIGVRHSPPKIDGLRMSFVINWSQKFVQLGFATGVILSSQSVYVTLLLSYD